MLQVRIEIPEGVNKAALDDSIHLGTLFISKSGVASVGLRILNINLVMGDVKVSAVYYRLGSFQFFDLCEKNIFPRHPVVKPFQLITGVWDIYCNEIELLKLKGDNAPFCIMLRNSDSV